MNEKNSTNDDRKLNVASFFSGGGGLDLGLEGGFTVHRDSVNFYTYKEYKELDEIWIPLKRLKFETVFANDIEVNASKVWNNYFSQRGNIRTYKVQSIVDLVKEWKREPSTIPQDIDLVTGGFPCKDFSLSGNRQGFKSQKDHTGKKTEQSVEENRGKLYFNYIKI